MSNAVDATYEPKKEMFSRLNETSLNHWGNQQLSLHGKRFLRLLFFIQTHMVRMGEKTLNGTRWHGIATKHYVHEKIKKGMSLDEIEKQFCEEYNIKTFEPTLSPYSWLKELVL